MPAFFLRQMIYLTDIFLDNNVLEVYLALFDK